MFTSKVPVESVEKIQDNIFILKVYSPEIAKAIKPGQFCNIKVSETDYPLLRRPFSISDVEGDFISFMFNKHGEGTRILSEKNKDDIIDILAPLGNGFNYNDDFDIAVMVGGGLGAAPFPFLTREIKNKKIITLIGGRSKNDVTDWGMQNIYFSTDDGSIGFHGNVVELLKSKMSEFTGSEIKIFACGPTPMLKALQKFTIDNNIKCEISTECAMACGFGICQGCPIDSREQGKDKYYLVCKDGPVFDAEAIVL
ncbi:MAG: dihydroorotate dehydrogenase [Ignavibacteria bacterium GWB2_35_6b]|nr:MAG: dihydroorotate dehydrogenase [Ignavibacteria bacterium GWB2_35_6b]